MTKIEELRDWVHQQEWYGIVREKKKGGKKNKETLCLVCCRYVPNEIWHRKKLPHWKECEDAINKSGLDIWTFHKSIMDSPYRYYYDKKIIN